MPETSFSEKLIQSARQVVAHSAGKMKLRASTYYTCGKCRFIFERVGEVESCPDCASTNVREATGAETREFLDNQAEFGNDKGGREPCKVKI